jgi:hypothetical protein
MHDGAEQCDYINSELNCRSFGRFWISKLVSKYTFIPHYHTRILNAYSSDTLKVIFIAS